MCVELITGAKCGIGIIQKSFKIRGVRVMFVDDISAMRCVFGEEV